MMKNTKDHSLIGKIIRRRRKEGEPERKLIGS